MTAWIAIKPLTTEAFSPFGDILDCTGTPDKIINQGLCERYNDRATMDFGPDGRAGISIFKSQKRTLPYTLDLVERHPLGSQAFIPMSMDPFLVIVAEGQDDEPGTVHAYQTAPGQGINFRRNIWHGVLTPLAEPGLFAVIDRIGDGNNLQEHWFKEPIEIVWGK